MRSKGGYLVLADGGWSLFTAQTRFFSHTGMFLPPSPLPFLETPPGWQGCCAGPFKNYSTPPLEGWPRRVDSESAAFVLVLCPGCSWREDGGVEKQEEEGWGGQRGSRVSETRHWNRLYLPSGEGSSGCPSWS